MALTDTIHRLHGDYRRFRNDRVPFPLESVLAWYVLLALQEALDVRGDILEMGVEHGGTAFLEAVSLRPGETLDLIDLKKSPRFAAMAETLPDDIAARVRFHECSTRAPELDAIAARRFRFVHIDAGHAKRDVLDDIARFAGCVAGDGILCLDDVFEIRWPGVTEAVFEALPATALRPFLFVNRKLYCAHPDMADRYRAALAGQIEEIGALAPLRHWTEEMMGAPTMIWKMAVQARTLDALI